MRTRGHLPTDEAAMKLLFLGLKADSDDVGQRFRLKADADSDPSRTGIPMIPDRVVVDVVMGSGGGLGVKYQRLGGPFSQ